MPSHGNAFRYPRNTCAHVVLARIVRAHVGAEHRRNRGISFGLRIATELADEWHKKRIEQTMEETGFPGRPRTRMSPMRPCISGFPGRMAMRQKPRFHTFFP